jgi:hypothetical protein
MVERWVGDAQKHLPSTQCPCALSATSHIMGIERSEWEYAFAAASRDTLLGSAFLFPTLCSFSAQHHTN